MTVNSYFEHPGISNSSLGAIDPSTGGTPKKFKNYLDGNREFKESLSLERGSLLHLWVEHPESFIIAEVVKPSDAMCKWVEAIKSFELYTNADIIKVKEDLGIFRNYKNPDKIIELFITEGTAYLEFLRKADGKIPMTPVTKQIVTTCQESLKQHQLASALLFNDQIDVLANIQVFSELEVYWTEIVSGIPLELKAKLDRFFIDFDKKRIRLVDLKTTSKSAYLFKETFEFWRYYRQIAFYKLAIKKYCEQQGINISGWSFEAYMVVVETVPLFQTVVWQVSNEWLAKGREEYTNLLNLIAWHTENNQWDYTQEEYSNNLILTL